MLKKSIVMTVLTVAVVGLAAVAWAGGAGPGWEPRRDSMMGQGVDQGSWDQRSGSDMAAWMERMHGAGPDDESSWGDLAGWMAAHHAAHPGVCPLGRYASPGTGKAPAG